MPPPTQWKYDQNGGEYVTSINQKGVWGLLRFLSKRILTIIISLAVIVTITYILMTAAPGSFLDTMKFDPQTGYGDRRSFAMGEAEAQAVRREWEARYGLDKPMWYQIAIYLKSALIFRFGPSFTIPQRNIEDLIAERFPTTVLLAVASLALSLLIGMPLGIIAALRKNTWIDYACMWISLIGNSIPSYVIAVGMMLIFSVYLGWLPTGGWGTLKTMIMPVVALGLGPIGGISRYIRSSLLDSLEQDYIRTAYAKGGWDRVVIISHALRNSLIPLVTIVGPQLAFMMAGTVWIEQMFRINGVGRIFVNAAGARDYPLIVTSTYFLALLVMVMNLLVDITYALLDPRIKYE